MRNRWFLRTAALLLLFFGGVPGAHAVLGPRIEAAQMKHDFGQVKAGERAEHLFEIRNSGDEVLVIQKIQSA